MTAFRHPACWNTRRRPGERPNLLGSWVLGGRVCKTTRDYWVKIHWATPPWMTENLFGHMRAVYNSANPAFDHVDHIVPLRHPLVCGLHVPWNLQVITGRANLAKSNHWWPDCPDHLCPRKNSTMSLIDEDLTPHQLSIPIC